MSGMKIFRGVLPVLMCAMAAQAGTILLNPVVTVHQYQQTTNNPCVIGDSSCNNPATFPNYTLLPVASSYDSVSPTYTVADIRGIVGNSFIMGFDVNQTEVTQTLSLFTMSINGSVVDTYSASPATLVPPTVGGGNGNGYADYTFTGFTSLASYASTATVQFRLVMPLVNDGREQVFLISSGGGGGGGQAVPEPVSFLLAGSGLIAMYFVRRRRPSSR